MDPDLVDKLDYESKTGEGALILPTAKEITDNIQVMYQFSNADQDVLIKLVKKLYIDKKAISAIAIKEILVKNIEETPEPIKQECDKEIENKIAIFLNESDGDSDGKKIVDWLVETSKNPLCSVVSKT